MSNGNATIKLATGVNAKNQIIFRRYPVWLYGVQFSVRMDFTSPQVLRGIEWSPIRLQGDFQFSINWPAQTNTTTSVSGGDFDFRGFKYMNQFHNSLRFHHQLATTMGSTPPFMEVIYNNNSLADNLNPIVDNNLLPAPDTSNLRLEPIKRSGFIRVVNKEYDRFKNVYTNNYQMEILVPRTQPIATITQKNQNPYIVPCAEDVLKYGPQWTKVQPTLTTGINLDGVSN